MTTFLTKSKRQGSASASYNNLQRSAKQVLIGFDGSRAFINEFVSSAFKRSFQASLIGERTGTENYSYQLLKALAKIDHKNHYLVYTKPVTQNSTAVERYVNWPANFTIRQIPWQRFWTQGGLALQSFKDNLDVLFVPAHTLPIIRKPGLKTVITVHDLGSEYLPFMHQLKQRLYLSFMQKYQLKGATKIIAVSKATKNDLLNKIGIESDRIEVIYEGYDKELFKPVKGDQPKTYVSARQKGKVLPKAGSYYLFVGTVQPRKNLVRLIQAFAKFLSTVYRQQSTVEVGSRKSEDFKLIIAGSKGWLADEIYKLPKKLGIEDKVKFLGYVPEKDLPALYSGAIALVFPSLYEGFGLPILEAQACSCPVITSNISSMPEVAGPVSPRLRGVKKGAIFVDPYEVDDITNGMIEAMNAKVRNQLIKAGFENIKRFSWEKCAAQTLEVFEDLKS